MAITKSDITTRLEALKKWQENNADKIHTEAHLEGYNAAVNSEILFLEDLLNSSSEKPVKQIVVKTKSK